MCLPDAIRQRILELMELNNVKTINAVSSLAGISNTLNDFMNGKNDLPKLDTLLHVCEGFNIQLYDFSYSPLFTDVQYEKPKK